MKFNLLPYARSRKRLIILNRILICVMFILFLYFMFERINLTHQQQQALRLEKQLAQFDSATLEAQLWIHQAMQNNMRIKKLIIAISQSMPEKMQLQKITLNATTLRLHGSYDHLSTVEHFKKLFNARPYQLSKMPLSHNKHRSIFTLNYENTHVDTPKNLY